MATLWTAYLLAGLATLTAVLVAFASVIVTRHRVEAAADLSALAGAAYGPWGVAYVCEQARWVSDRMNVRLDRCELAGWVVDVQVSGSVGGLGVVSASARAGP